MKIRLIVKHTYKPKNPVRTIVKSVIYHANPDGTVTTTSSKKVIRKPAQADTETKNPNTQETPVQKNV